MRTTLTALTVVLAMGAVAACSDQGSGPLSRPTTPSMGASGASGGGGVLTPDDVRAKLRDQGFTNVSDLKREGAFYQGEAMRGTQRYHVTIDSRTGRVDSSPY